MVTVSAFKAGNDIDLAPNQTFHWKWNNANPGIAVWNGHAVPVATGSTNTGFAQHSSVEVTRIWHELIVTEIKPFPQSQTVETKVEHEIHLELKNLSNAKNKVSVYLSAIKP